MDQHEQERRWRTRMEAVLCRLAQTLGIGFKAVLSYTQRPCIQSADAAFRITDVVLPEIGLERRYLRRSSLTTRRRSACPAKREPVAARGHGERA